MSLFGCGKSAASAGEDGEEQQRRRQNERTHLLEAAALHQADAEEEEGTGAADDTPASSARTLGTFEGVFAPVSLSMLSSILFLRVGYIVGNSGLLFTLLQLLIAYSILGATVLSICAIATNGAVEGGGVYFMISRTLGAEIGTSVGILFWVGNIVSSALYLTACVEGLLGSFGPDGSLADFLPDGSWGWRFLYCSALNTVNFLVCVYGSKIFGKASTIILAVVAFCTLLTMGSFFGNFEYDATFVYNATSDCLPPTGNSTSANCTKVANGSFVGLWAATGDVVVSTLASNLYQQHPGFDCSDPTAEVNFFKVFGVLFSGVTGIMAGANMSGELVAPSQNIPRGTLSACLFTLTTLTLMALLTCLTCSPELLLHDCMYLSEFSYYTGIVTVGVLMATFSAALNNIIGASRVLEAVFKDILVGKALINFARPLICVSCTWLMVELVLIMGSLNKIAQLSTVLFLLSYASVNLACLGLDVASAPNFRPTFRYFSWRTSLVGLTGCIAMMLLVAPFYSVIGILLCVSLVAALNFILPIRKESWGSISQALLFHQVRKYLLLLDSRKAHVKFWRPQILLLVSNPRTSCALIDFVNAVKKGGLFVIGHVYNERLGNLERDPCVEHQNDWLSLIDHLRVKAFVELTLSISLREGFGHLVRISGIGAMKPNTVIVGYLDTTFHGDDFLSPSSPYVTADLQGAFPPLRSADTGHSQSALQISKQDYVGTVCDLIKMEKNVCLSRHFQLLNTDSLFGPERQSIFGTRTRKKVFLDAWLIDFFSHDVTPISDTTSLFLLQLACIVNMVPRWKTLRLRVFIADPSGEAGGGKQLLLLRQMLELLRIRAEAHVLDWIAPTAIPCLDELEASSGEPSKLSDLLYLKSAAEMVRDKSATTAVTFLYLPSPPKDEGEHVSYLDRLTVLTEQWPPTMMVRGVSPVTSFNL